MLWYVSSGIAPILWHGQGKGPRWQLWPRVKLSICMNTLLENLMAKAFKIFRKVLTRVPETKIFSQKALSIFVNALDGLGVKT